MVDDDKKKRWVWPYHSNRKWLYGLALSLLLMNLQSFEPILDLLYAKEWSMDDKGLNLGGNKGRNVVMREHNALKGPSRGYTMCVGDEPPMVTSAMYKIKELRTTWNSTLPMMIAQVNWESPYRVTGFLLDPWCHGLKLGLGQ